MKKCASLTCVSKETFSHHTHLDLVPMASERRLFHMVRQVHFYYRHISCTSLTKITPCQPFASLCQPFASLVYIKSALGAPYGAPSALLMQTHWLH